MSGRGGGWDHSGPPPPPPSDYPSSRGYDQRYPDYPQQHQQDSRGHHGGADGGGHHGSSEGAKNSRPAVSRDDGSRKKKSRWDPLGSKTFIPGVPSFLPVVLSKEASEAFMLRVRIDEITHKISSGQLDIAPERERSPSPPPQYDGQGKRVNTREMRAKEKLNRERQKLVERSTELLPTFKPPSDYKPVQTKKTRKYYIPIKKYPEYNFIGLIIGPRGITQKQMEKETGAKIAIRGRGSVKDGKTKMDKKWDFGEDDDLHVLISADTDEQLEIASRRIEKLLVPIDEEQNEHKKNQLRQLAVFNGTLRDNNWAIQQGKFNTGMDVNCKICGEPSHPTSDCPLKNQPGVKHKIDKEYESFLAEIGEAPAKKPEGADAAYEEFMASLGSAPPPPGQGGAAPPPWASHAPPPSQAPAPWTPQPPPPGMPGMGMPPAHAMPPWGQPQGYPPQPGYPPQQQQAFYNAPWHR